MNVRGPKYLIIVACGLVLAGCGSFMEGWNAEQGRQAQRRQEMLQYQPVLLVPTPSTREPGLFDYATGKKPTCTNPTGYGVGC